MKPRLIAIALLATPPLTACATFPTSPSTVAGSAILDEQVDTSVQLAYKAVRLAMELAVDSSKLKGPAAARVSVLNDTAFAASQAVHKAYLAGNATDYATAFKQAQEAIAAMIAALK